MNYFFLFLCLLLATSSSIAQTDSTQSKPVSPAKLVQQTSYAYGYSFAKDLITNDNFEAAERGTNQVIQGLKDGLEPDSAKLEEIVGILMKRIDEGEAAATPEAGQVTAYNLGYNALGNLVSLLDLDKKDLHYKCIKKGYLDYAKGKTPKVSLERQEKVLADFFKEKQALAQEREKARRAQQAIDNLSTANKFLAENAQKASIKTTGSGLQYQVIKEGKGERPSVNSRVSAHYSGTFINGKVFDSSIERGTPTEFRLSQVIQGWQEGIPMMRVGSRYRFFIPPALAYGAGGPAAIPPNSLLIFDVELLEIIQEEGPGTDIKKMSYSYGYAVGKALVATNFTAAETNVEQFVKGFDKGFENQAANLKAIEALLQSRMASSTPTTKLQEAAIIAQGIGYTSSAGLVKLMQAHRSDFAYKALGEGYKAGLEQRDPLYNQEDMSAALEAYIRPQNQQRPQAEQPNNNTALAENLKKGQEFLLKNSIKEGVISLPSGLQYQVIKEGTGPQPSISSNVTTHYTGTLIDGTVFDSSVERGQPATFPLRAVIKGWQEGIPLMQQGAKYRFFIPANLAYGNSAKGGVIQAGSTLIFEVELLEVE